MERFTCELVYDRSAPACHDARYFDACRPELKIGLEFDRQKQRFERFRACGRKDGKKIAQRSASRSEEHTSELQSLMRIPYAVFCLKKKKNKKNQPEPRT